MEGFSRKSCQELWDSKLELRLGPPGEEEEEEEKQDWGVKYRAKKDSSSSSSSSLHNFNTPWSISSSQTMGKEHTTAAKVELQNAENKGPHNTPSPASHKRITPAPVVGWPPIRSFRKNLASGCASKLPAETDASNEVSTKIASNKQTVSCQKGFFVKINMDGVPIGRKVDLKAYDSYEKLSSAVDELFRGLLAAQIDPSANNIHNKKEGEKAITGLLDGSGEYTLVYEDNEGDRMLVGDVPWNMFVSTVKRLRVLKSSELSSLILGSKQGKEPS